MTVAQLNAERRVHGFQTSRSGRTPTLHPAKPAFVAASKSLVSYGQLVGGFRASLEGYETEIFGVFHAMLLNGGG